MSIAWHDVVGLAGVGLMLLAYFGLQAGRVRSDGLDYQLANLIGAALVLVSLLVEFNLSAFVIETAWVLISLYGIVRARRARRSPPR
ncbi:MAG TPA: hypothetical protein VEY50_04235 [Lysobacter sp.]|nr:hypothetical protein [Lysobacter sp.]